jgi:hypothetical protein
MIRSSRRISLQDREREMVAGCRGHKLDLKAKGRKGEVFEKGPDTPLQELGLRHRLVLSPPCSAGEVARSTLKSHGLDDSSRSVESSLRRFLDPARLGKSWFITTSSYSTCLPSVQRAESLFVGSWQNRTR